MPGRHCATSCGANCGANQSAHAGVLATLVAHWSPLKRRINLRRTRAAPLAQAALIFGASHQIDSRSGTAHVWQPAQSTVFFIVIVVLPHGEPLGRPEPIGEPLLALGDSHLRSSSLGNSLGLGRSCRLAGRLL